MTSPFPVYRRPEAIPFPRERVVDYLLRLTAEGATVQVDGEDFVVPFDDGHGAIRPDGEAWKVWRTRWGVASSYGTATNERELDDLIGLAFEFRLGAVGPHRGRLAADKPATNLRTISRLIGGAAVTAVFDPYLDNQGLAHLIDILSFGSGTAAASVRLLSSTDTIQKASGKPPRFTKTGVAAWAGQLGITAEARYLPAKPEHRRFLLLDGGQSLILGPSFNSLGKNEATHVEDDREDLPFFEERWRRATPLP